MKYLMSNRLYFFLFLPIFLYCNFNTQAQDSLTWQLLNKINSIHHKGLQIGDKLPDIAIEKITQYSNTSVRTSDFKGRLLILDFWHQYCSTCVAAFPKLYNLQKLFGDSIIILPVTFQSKTSIEAFFAKRKQLGKEILLPSVVEDTILHTLFPHTSDPYEVWINGDGQVVAITHNLYVTASNIQHFLHGRNYQLPHLNQQLDFDLSKPLLVAGNGGRDDDFIFRSLLTGFIDSIGSQSVFQDSIAGRSRLFIPNNSLIGMYKNTFETSPDPDSKAFYRDLYNKRIIIESKLKILQSDWISFMQTHSDGFEEFKQTHFFCYESIFPQAINRQEAFQQMRHDLDRLFGLRSVVQLRKIPCLELVELKSRKKWKTKNKKDILTVSEDKNSINVEGVKLEDLVELFNSHYKIPIMLNKTGYIGNITMKLFIEDSDDLSLIKKSLRIYGLGLRPGHASIRMLVLSDK